MVLSVGQVTRIFFPINIQKWTENSKLSGYKDSGPDQRESVTLHFLPRMHCGRG